MKKDPLKTPMMKQYLKYREQHEDAILFFRLGDFYEMFFEDARIASEVLDIALTSRHKDAGIPMAGIPAHSMESYAKKLLDAGHRIAVCEQVEKPDRTKKMVRRDVVRVLTPGTVVEESSLDEGNNYLAAVCVNREAAGVVWGDVSSGEVFFSAAENTEELTGLLRTVSAREVIALTEIPEINAEMVPREKFELWVPSQRSAEYMEAHGRLFSSASVLEQAFHLILWYLDTAYFGAYPPLQEPREWFDDSVMRLDYNTIANLEIERTLMGARREGSLLHAVDRTRTAMGRRNLTNTLKTPLTDRKRIEARYDAVSTFMEKIQLTEALTAHLKDIRDFERVVSRILVKRGGPREILALAESLDHTFAVRRELAEIDALPGLLSELAEQISLSGEIPEQWAASFVDDPPVQYRDGGFVAREYSPDVAELYDTIHNSKDLLLELEAREREATDIPSLKIGHTRVFGYYIEVRKRYADHVPDRYIRKQTMRNAERYFTGELKELENNILHAREKLTELELEILETIVTEVEQHEAAIRRAARSIAWIDTLLSFALVSRNQRYCRPMLSQAPGLMIRDARHPVIEMLIGRNSYVPATVNIGSRDRRMNIITGPNMGGKSTLMRTVALITILAQAGCYVPAAEAELSIADAVFTRVGASDNLSRGESTFLVEMKEASAILSGATDRSLVILDEIGRGTGTYDGMSLARAIAAYLVEHIGALTMFATHYHMLTELADEYDSVSNFYMDAREYRGSIRFLYQLREGGSSRSFGIEVAKLAGMPEDVVQNAERHLRDFEKLDRRMRFEQGSSMQLDIFSMAMEHERSEEKSPSKDLIKLSEIIENNDPDKMTPRRALDLFYTLKKLADSGRE